MDFFFYGILGSPPRALSLEDRLWQQDESIIVGCVATMSCDAGSCGVEEEWRAGAENPRHDTNGPTEDK